MYTTLIKFLSELTKMGPHDSACLTLTFCDVFNEQLSPPKILIGSSIFLQDNNKKLPVNQGNLFELDVSVSNCEKNGILKIGLFKETLDNEKLLHYMMGPWNQI